MMLRLMFATLAVLLWASAPLADPDPMKWGDIPDALLDMESYPSDPDAQALILGDFGVAKVENDWTITFERHRRIKILTEGGYDQADIVLTYNAEDRYQKISKIQGQTFVREPGGGMRRIKLDKKSIFTEDLEGGFKRVKFTLPALEPGAIVEFRYRLTTESPLRLPRWYFQDEEPVLHSELRFEHPVELAYSMITQGSPDFAIRTEKDGVRASGSVRNFRWVAQDVPALREERYMTTLQDYVQKIDVQLVEYYRSGVGAVRVIKSWDQLVEDIRESQGIGRKLKVSGAVRREAEQITQGLTDPEEKARALYDFVRNSIVWSGEYRAFADDRLENVLRDKRGSSAEINLLLVALLREAGLTANPAMLSTRGHGRIIRIYPLLSQFNYTVAALKQGRRWQLLDATDPFRPYEMLPVRALNESALVVAEGPEWVSVAGGMSEHMVYLDATLEADGTLAGTLRSEKQGYAGIVAREQVREDGDESYVTDHLVDDVAGIEVEHVEVTGAEDASERFVAEVTFRIPSYAQAVGDLLLVNPLVMLRAKENPFKLARRTYPIDFAYPLGEGYTARIALPEGYAVDEAPQDALSLLPLRAGGYERSVAVEDGVLVVSAQYRLRKTFFEPNVYGDVKGFFDRVVEADAETVVLTKAVSPPEATLEETLEDAVEPDAPASNESEETN